MKDADVKVQVDKSEGAEKGPDLKAENGNVEKVPSPTEPQRMAWLVLCAAFCTGFMTIGVFYCSGVLFALLLDEFNESRGATALAGGIMMASVLALNTFQGRLQRRFSPRAIAAVGAIISGCGLLTSALAQQLWHLYPTLALVGIGGGLSFPPSLTMVATWFATRRALASALAGCGASAGAATFGFVIRPFAEAFGVRHAFLALGALHLLLVGTASYFFQKPAHLKVPPPAKTSEAQAAKPSMPQQSKEDTVWACPGFQFLVVAGCCQAFAFWVPVVHGVRFLRDLGVSPGHSDGFTNALGFGGFFRVFLGMLADRYGRTITFGCVKVFMGGMLLVLHSVGNGPVALVWIWAALYGCCVGATMSLFPPMCAEVVGISRVASAYGIAFGVFSAPGLLMGPFLAGLAFDQTGSYEIPFALAGCILILGGVSVFMARWRAKNSRNSNPQPS